MINCIVHIRIVIGIHSSVSVASHSDVRGARKTRLISPVAGEGHLGVLGVLKGHLSLGGPDAVGTIVLPGDVDLVSRVESSAELATVDVAHPSVGHVARLESNRGLHSVAVIQLVGDGQDGVLISIVILDAHSCVIHLEFSAASDSLLQEIIGGTDVPVVAVKLLVGGSRDGSQLVIRVALSVELKLVVIPLAVEVKALGTDGVISINSSSAIRSKVKGTLGEEFIRSTTKITKGSAEAYNIVLELERGSPLHIKAVNAIDSGILHRGGDGLQNQAIVVMKYKIQQLCVRGPRNRRKIRGDEG